MLASFKEIDHHTGLHSSAKGDICVIALHPSNPSLLLTGGLDKNAVLFDLSARKNINTLKGHTKKVTLALLHRTEEVAVTASPDSSIRVWSTATGKVLHEMHPHSNAAITVLALHPSGFYLLSAADNQSWALTELSSGQVLTVVQDGTGASTTCGAFHPDGNIFALGASDGIIRVWDVRHSHWKQERKKEKKEEGKERRRKR